jgi:homoprotocatechuate degradation regulator HpaR
MQLTAVRPMRANDPEHRNLPLLLLHAREAALAHFRPILKKFHLTEQQWRILRVLAAASEAGLEAGQIADKCKILSPSLTGIVSRLEQMELVHRQWSEIDQRRQIIGLTERGSELVARVSPLVDAQYRRIEETLGPATLSEIYQAIDRVTDLLGQPMPSALGEASAESRAAESRAEERQRPSKERRPGAARGQRAR